MARRYSASQIRSRLRQAQQKQQRATTKYNDAVRRHNQGVRTAVNRFEAVLGGDLLLWDHDDWHGWRVNVYGGTLLRLRMSKRRSSPVSTPSFEPKATMQFIRLWKTSNSSASAWILNVVPWAHHSNGQEGCALMRQTRMLLKGGDLGDCVPDEDFDPTNPEITWRTEELLH